MDASELRQLVTKPEWTEVELKASRNQYPKEALSTVSAFANSGRGYLVFGVDERKPDPLVGVARDKIDEIQNAFIGILKDTHKFSSIIRFNADLVELNENYFLVFQIEEALRHEKPVYLNGEMKQTFLRKGGCDNKAGDEEIKRMVRDASQQSSDEQLLELDPENCFDTNTLKWYRKIYESRHGQKYFELSNLEFLDQFGLVKEQNDDLKPTLGSVLMFGTEKTLRHLIPRYILDVFWHHTDFSQADEDIRWHDRRSYESNLFDAWRQLADRFMYYAEHPFDIDETNLQRKNEPPDYIGFKEAAINALIHQDYSDKTRIATVHFYKDASVYFNPGDSLVDESQLGKGNSASRNPVIMQTFLRIGLSDRAGSGLKDIYKNWQLLDWPRPEIINDKGRKTFQITLGKKPIISELQRQCHQRIGVKLSNTQAQVFISCLKQPQTIEQLATLLNLSSAEIYQAIDHLNRQGLVIADTSGYLAPDHFQSILNDLAGESDQPSKKVTNLTGKSDQPLEKVTNLAEKSDQPQAEITNPDNKTDQAEVVLKKLNKKQKLLIIELEETMALQMLMAKLNQSHRSHFKNKQLQPLIDLGLILSTHPENPHHQDQAYYLTELGLLLKQPITDGG